MAPRSVAALAFALLAAAIGAQAAVPVINSFTASRTNMIAGQTTFLNWSVTGSNTLTLDQGIGDVTGTTSHPVTPSATTRYTLTATNASGSASASVLLPFVPLAQLSPTLYQTEHALYLIADNTQVLFPDWNSVYSTANVASYVATLKAQYPDDYLMVVAIANQLVPSLTPNVLTYRHIADGIGQGSVVGIGVPNICRHNIGTGSVFEPALSVFDHEIGHNWGVQVGIELGSGHWYSNTTVGGQLANAFSDDGFTTVKHIVGDPAAGFTWVATNNLVANQTEIFADQDLYAMGLQPVFPDTYFLANAVYNADGTMGYTAATKYDYAWALNKNGPRVPGYQASEKRLRFGFIYVARDLTEIQNVYQGVERSIQFFANAEAIDIIHDNYEVPFLVETKYRGSISARLADLDGNAAPAIALTGPSYLISTDGNATVPFAASDPDGPAPAVSVVPASANATIAGNNVVVQGLAPGTWFFTVKAQDSFGKKSFAHFVVDVAPPAAYAFTPQAGAALSSVATSNAITLNAITAGTPITIAGGNYAINGGAYRSTNGIVNPGDSVTVRLGAAASYATGATAMLLVGYQGVPFTVTTVAAPVALVAVQSRRVHGAAGPFDIAIDTAQAIGGTVTVEPRMIGAGHTIVFQFDGPVLATGTVACVDALGAPVGTASASASGNDIVITLTGIPDKQRVSVSLAGVNGSLDAAAAIGFLVGDADNSRSVTGADILLVMSRSGQPAGAGNFRADLNASGSITAADVLAAKGRSGNTL